MEKDKLIESISNDMIDQINKSCATHLKGLSALDAAYILVDTFKFLVFDSLIKTIAKDLACNALEAPILEQMFIKQFMGSFVLLEPAKKILNCYDLETRH